MNATAASDERTRRSTSASAFRLVGLEPAEWTRGRASLALIAALVIAVATELLDQFV